MGRKGISPLIAAVMLIAFVMAIGGLFSEWSGQLATESTSRTADDQDKILDCSSRTIQIDRVQSNSNWANITVEANGGELGNVTVTIFPAKQQQIVQLTSDGDIAEAKFPVSQRQTRVTAAANECRASIDHDISY